MTEGIVVKPKDCPTPQELVDLGNKRVLEIVGVFFVLSKTSQRDWMRKNGWVWNMNDRYGNKELGRYFCTIDDVFDTEIRRALFNSRSLLTQS